jgi:hypothetical protein
MPESETSIVDYIRWLSAEVTGIPEVFAVVEGTLIMAGDSIYLATFQTMATDSGADTLLTGQDVQKVACEVSKKWCRCFGYNYLLAAILAKLREVIAHM